MLDICPIYRACSYDYVLKQYSWSLLQKVFKMIPPIQMKVKTKLVYFISD
jgi:hypothetical protein